MTRKILSLLLMSALPAVALAGEGHAHAKHEEKAKVELKKMTIDEVAAKIDKKETIHVFDNNSAERFAEGHLPGAKWLKYDAVLAKDLPQDKDATLVFYCANERCMACHKAAYTATDLGYKNVFIMPAGIMGWEKAQKPVEKGAPERS